MTAREHSSLATPRSRTSKRAERLYSPLYLSSLLAVLMFGVLAFGASETWANSILEIGAALLFIATQLAGDSGTSKTLVLGFTLFGSAVALLGICQYLSAATRIYWLHWPATTGNFFGTYVNRDHYAGLMEMLTPFALVLSLSRLIHGGQRMLAGFAAIIMAGSIVLTRPWYFWSLRGRPPSGPTSATCKRRFVGTF
jgi:hypothetical protein